MKAIKVVVATVVLSSLIITGNVAEITTDMTVRVWNRYTAISHKGEITKSQFAVKRGYFRLEPKFSDDIYGRFNLDFFSDDDSPDGGGIKVQYAYLNFRNVLPVPKTELTAGLIKNRFGTIYQWDYWTITQALEDREDVIASADMKSLALN